jgi:hypothetical protein
LFEGAIGKAAIGRSDHFPDDAESFDNARAGAVEELVAVGEE